MQIIEFRQEILLELSNTDKEKWIAFYWIIKYLSENTDYEISSFKEEKNEDVRMRYQVIRISEALEANIERIIDFFDPTNYKKQYEQLHSFIHADLSKRGLLRRHVIKYETP